jgi:hypothetical protein
MRRDAMVPIDVALAATIAAQQQVLGKFPTTEHLLVRERRNPLGQLHYSADTFRHRLAGWLATGNVRDELGRPVHVTPHQWRHAYATRGPECLVVGLAGSALIRSRCRWCRPCGCSFTVRDIHIPTPNQSNNIDGSIRRPLQCGDGRS